MNIQMSDQSDFEFCLSHLLYRIRLWDGLAGCMQGRLRGGERGIIETSSKRCILGVHVCVMTKPPSLFEAKDRGVLIRCEFNGSIGR